MPLLARVSGLSLLGGHPEATAVVAGDRGVTYAELADHVEARREVLGDVRRLVMIEAANALEPLVTYLAAIAGSHPVLFVPSGSDEASLAQRTAVIERFDPDVIARDSAIDVRRDGTRHRLHPELALLASTSGSTGSPKLVRLSAENLRSNAAAIAEYLRIDSDDRAATTLPMQYCYGLSVINSHLLSGGGLLLTERSVAEEAFWHEAEAHEITSFAGVPYTFELLDATGFAGRELPSLRYLTQAGGRMAPETVTRYAELGAKRGFELFVMYGQTEATARMSYLPPEMAATAAGAIGRPIPGGRFRLDAQATGAAEGAAVVGETAGELVYEGPNVMLGYAECSEDLALGRTVSELRTGDLARRRADGLYEIVGRLNRFVKVFGLRVDLDRVEQMLAEEGIEARAASADDRLLLFAASERQASRAAARAAALVGIPRHTIGAYAVAEFPRTSSGKIDSQALVQHAKLVDGAASAAAAAVGRFEEGGAGPSPKTAIEPTQVRELYAVLLGQPGAGVDDSFASLGGDSLSYIEVTLQLETMLGELPRDWPTMTPRQLASRASRSGPGAVEAGAPTPQTSDGLAAKLRGFVRFETPAALRALAIVLIVGTHADLFALKGGAHLLLAVAGYNLARFQLAGAPSGRTRRLLRSAVQLVVPAVIWIGLVALVTGQYRLTTVLLVNNFVPGDGRWNEQWQFWFLEAMLWAIAGIAVIMAIAPLRRIERRAPFATALVVLAVALATRFALVGAHAEYVERYTAAAVLWLVALGWLIARARSVRQRVLVSVVTALSVYGFFGDVQRESIVALGVLLLIWVPTVPLPRVLVPIIATLASASMFIYLTHWQVYPPFEQSAPWLGTLLSLGIGVIAWKAYGLASRQVARWRDSRAERSE